MTSSDWTSGNEIPVTTLQPAVVRHQYPLAVRDVSITTATGLVLQSLPYALARFGVLLGTSLIVLIWLVVMIGGASWLSTHIASIFGLVWFVAFLLGGGFFWGTVVRYILHVIECGHVAVLTELITKGAVGNGSESMFAYGRRIVTERFTEANLLFGLNALVRGVVESIHRTLDWISDLIPIPGLESVASVVNIILKGATRYLDKVIFSYNLARNDGDPWTSSREGLVYYAQNAKPILKTAITSIIAEYIISFFVWLIFLIPAALITRVLPGSTREFGGLVTIILALMIAGSLRAAVVKPIFLVLMMLRYHTIIEGQPIHQEWDNYLSSISTQFRDFGQAAAANLGQPRWARGWK